MIYLAGILAAAGLSFAHAGGRHAPHLEQALRDGSRIPRHHLYWAAVHSVLSGTCSLASLLCALAA